MEIWVNSNEKKIHIRVDQKILKRDVKRWYRISIAKIDFSTLSEMASLRSGV